MHATGVNAYSITEQQLDIFASNNLAIHVGSASACATTAVSALLYLVTGNDTGLGLVSGLLAAAAGMGLYFGWKSFSDFRGHKKQLESFKKNSVEIAQVPSISNVDIYYELQAIRRSLAGGRTGHRPQQSVTITDR